MTFLYDDTILKEFEAALQKHAQAVQPTAAFNPRQLQDVALKLVNNLKQAYSSIQVEGRGELLPSNMLNLTNLVDWMVDNRVKYNGSLIAVPNYLDAQNQQGVSYIEYDAGRGGKGGAGGGRNPFVWREGLIAFLEDLRKQASDGGNRLFMEQVSNIINQANNMQGLELALDEEERRQEPAAKKPEEKTVEAPAERQLSPAQQVVYRQTKEIVDTVQQVSGSSSPALPFDLTTNQINIDLMRTFLRTMQELIKKPAFKEQMANYYSMFTSVVEQSEIALNNFVANATPEAARGGFQLDPTNPDAFVNTFARSAPNPYAKARMMLNSLVPLFQSMGSVVRGLQSSITLTELVSEAVIQAQYAAAMRYTEYAQSMISRVTSALTQRK